MNGKKRIAKSKNQVAHMDFFDFFITFLLPFSFMGVVLLAQIERLFPLIPVGLLWIFFAGLYHSGGMKDIFLFCGIAGGLIGVAWTVDLFDKWSQQHKGELPQKEEDKARSRSFFSGEWKVLSIHARFPPYDPFSMEYPEYKRWKDYCVRVDTIISYKRFRSLFIFPKIPYVNPLDKFLD